jgi:hypothetical protein
MLRSSQPVPISTPHHIPKTSILSTHRNPSSQPPSLLQQVDMMQDFDMHETSKIEEMIKQSDQLLRPVTPASSRFSHRATPPLRHKPHSSLKANPHLLYDRKEVQQEAHEQQRSQVRRRQNTNQAPPTPQPLAESLRPPSALSYQGHPHPRAGYFAELEQIPFPENLNKLPVGQPLTSLNDATSPNARPRTRLLPERAQRHTHHAETIISSPDDNNAEDQFPRLKPPLLRNKFGELVKPTIRPYAKLSQKFRDRQPETLRQYEKRPQAQTQQQDNIGGYPYTHPYYSSPHYAIYMNQFGGIGQEGGLAAQQRRQTVGTQQQAQQEPNEQQEVNSFSTLNFEQGLSMIDAPQHMPYSGLPINTNVMPSAETPYAPETSTSTGPELRSELRRLRQLMQMRERLRNARASQPDAETQPMSPRTHSDWVAFNQQEIDSRPGPKRRRPNNESNFDFMYGDAIRTSRQSEITIRNIHGSEGTSRSLTDWDDIPLLDPAHSKISSASYGDNVYHGDQGSVTDGSKTNGVMDTSGSMGRKLTISEYISKIEKTRKPIITVGVLSHSAFVHTSKMSSRQVSYTISEDCTNLSTQHRLRALKGSSKRALIRSSKHSQI